MSNLVPINASQLPAHLRPKDAAAVRALSVELSGGVTSSFPIISFRGKVWRIRKGTEEVAYTDANGDPVPSIEVVLVKSNKLPSKTYFRGKYVQGSNDAPTCWSSDGVKPDTNVQEKQHAACASCPRNAWGSKITEEGKKGRECSDVRRIAVVFAHELARKGTDAHVFLLRVPPDSLNPLKDYAEKVLGPAGVEYFGLVTRIGFEQQAAHPKLTFRVATEDNAPRFLSEAEYEDVLALRDGDDVARILNESPDYAEAGTTVASEAPAKAAEATPAPAPAPAARAQRPRPVDEEDVQIEDASPPPPPAPEPAPAPAPKRRARAATPAPEPTPAPAPARQPAAPAANKGGFDDLLDSLLA